MDKIRLVGGVFGDLTLQGRPFPTDRMYVGGHLYVWNRHIDSSNYREFIYSSIKALDE